MQTLSAFSSVVSGHQPMLFGTAGYWSKIALAHTHLVTFGVPFRRGDHLTRLELPGGQVAAPVQVLSKAPVILDAIVLNLSRVRDAVEQTFGARRRPYRHRIAPVLDALSTEPCSFAEVWARVARATAEAAGLPINWLPLLDPPVGADTQERLLNRLRGAVPGCDAYVVGPGGLDYLRPRELGDIRFFVHRMVDPSPRPFLDAIVDQAQPLDALRAYTLEPIE